MIDGTEIEDDQLVIVTSTIPRPDQTVGMDDATIWRIKLEADFVKERIDLENKVLVQWMNERILSRWPRPTLRVRLDRVV